MTVYQQYERGKLYDIGVPVELGDRSIDYVIRYMCDMSDTTAVNPICLLYMTTNRGMCDNICEHVLLGQSGLDIKISVSHSSELDVDFMALTQNDNVLLIAVKQMRYLQESMSTISGLISKLEKLYDVVSVVVDNRNWLNVSDIDREVGQDKDYTEVEHKVAVLEDLAMLASIQNIPIVVYHTAPRNMHEVTTDVFVDDETVWKT